MLQMNYYAINNDLTAAELRAAITAPVVGGTDAVADVIIKLLDRCRIHQPRRSTTINIQANQNQKNPFFFIHV